MDTSCTLVLNKHWVPVSTITVIDAIVLLCRETCRVLDTQTYELFDLETWLYRSNTKHFNGGSNYIRLVKGMIEKPEVIILSHYGGAPNNKINFNKRNIHKRDCYTCQYCNKLCSNNNITVDHIIPKAQGGHSTWDNCVTACKPCNHQKADKPLKSTSLKLIDAPKVPRWNPSFGIIPNKLPNSWSKFAKI